MRRLILLRHAKSAWPTGIEDRDRPLSARGRKAAPLIADYMASENLIPDLALVSPAIRTRETFAVLEERLPCPVRYEEGLYLGAPGGILALIRKTQPDIRTLAVIGHNPGLHELAIGLTGHGDRYAFARLSEKMPTAALTVLDFAVEDWAGIQLREARLDRYITPKSLGGEDED